MALRYLSDCWRCCAAAFSKAARQAAAFAGLVPVSWESGSSVRGRPRLSKAGNPKLRQSLYMAAVVGLRRNPDISALYQRLTGNGKSKMAALGQQCAS
nr:IS110 family transposase [Halomonas desiderata]